MRSAIVVVVGAINVDLVVVAPRLPGPGETVVGAGMRSYGGGKGANAAVAAARAGAIVHLIAAVGNDDSGAAALQDLQAEAINVSAVAILADQPTGVALIVVDAHGENQIAVGGGANAALTADHVRCSLRTVLGQADCVLVSSEIPAEAVAAAVREATAAGVQCILNPAPVDAAMLELLALGAVLTPNETELRDLVALLPQAETEGDSLQVGAQRLCQLTRNAVIVTRGAQGVLVVESGSPPMQIAAPAAEVLDTTGAGDTFNGVLAARTAAGDHLVRAAQVGVVAASLSVTVVGARAGMPTLAQIEQAMRVN